MDKDNTMRDEYAIKDLHIAAFLQTKGQAIKTLEQRKAGLHDVVYFIFKDIERCEELESIFWSGHGDEIMINAKEYFTAIRDLKSRISLVRRVLNKAG